MKRMFLGLAMVAALGMTMGCASDSEPPGPTDAEMVAAADELDARFAAAVNAGDLEGVSACYWNSPDVVSYLPGEMVARGYAEVVASAEEMITTFPGMSLELIEGKNISVGGAVVGHGLWRMTIPGPEGETLEMDGRYTDVKAELGGQWVYTIDHASVPLPSED